MDITKFILEGREQALLYGDHTTYQAALGRRLLSLRKKLGIVTKNRGKFHVKKEITAEEIASNPDYVFLGLLTSERAWAHALSMKTQHAVDSKGLTGKARSHIISRLHRAVGFARQVSAGIAARDSTITTDVLEARAYAEMLAATEAFERRQWSVALAAYSTTRLIYNALSTKGKTDQFKDLIAETLDPNIRYAAYQQKVPRTLPIDVIVRKHYPASADDALTAELNTLDPSLLSTATTDTPMPDADSAPVDTPLAIPKTITWRSREVPIEDGAIASAWARVQAHKAALSSLLEAAVEPKDKAGAYDDILESTQEAVDATKQAIDELRAEGVPQSDSRMQALQITRTAVTYEMISWQIGRNRVLAGSDDGTNQVYSELSRRQLKKLAAAPDATPFASEKPGRKLTKLKERTALYDGILRSVEQILELPGVASDSDLASALAAHNAYFTGLKCLAVGRSHVLTNSPQNALALFNHGHTLLTNNTLAPATPDSINAPSLAVCAAQYTTLAKTLAKETLRFRALVHLQHLRANASSTSDEDIPVDAPVTKLPILETLGTYPVEKVDVTNGLVEFPPKATLIPVKPIFLDVAWNYIEYPGRGGKTVAATATEPAGDKPAPSKKGWFGFGR